VHVCPKAFSAEDEQVSKPTTYSGSDGQCIKFNEAASFYVTSAVHGDCASGMVFRVSVQPAPAPSTTATQPAALAAPATTPAASSGSSQAIPLLGFSELTTGLQDSNVQAAAATQVDMNVEWRYEATGNRKMLQAAPVKTYVVDSWHGELCYPEIQAVVGDQLCVKWVTEEPHDVWLIKYEVAGSNVLSSTADSAALGSPVPSTASSPAPAVGSTVLAGLTGQEGGDASASSSTAPEARSTVETSAVNLAIDTSSSSEAVALVGTPALCLMDLNFLQQAKADVTFIKNALLAKTGTSSLKVGEQTFAYNEVWAELQKNPEAISGRETLLQQVLVGKINTLYGAAMSLYNRQAIAEGEQNWEHGADGQEAFEMASAIKSYSVSAAGCVQVAL
jgi:hypothetical protein